MYTSPSTAGINSRTVLHCLWGSVSPSGRQLDGVAVVSDIMAAQDAYAASKKLSDIIQSFYRSSFRTFSQPLSPTSSYTADGLKSAVGTILDAVKQFSPLVHQVSILPCLSSCRDS